MAERRFLVETYGVGPTPADVRAASRRLARAAAALGLRFGGSTFLPDEESCFFRFEGTSAEAVADACAAAEVAAARIHEVVDLEGEPCES
jgi:hypothetical protein